MHEKEWRETIINRLVPECGYYYIIYDPDYLLGDEKLYIQLKGKGFELLTYTNEIDFRILFEGKMRSQTDKSMQKELIIVLHSRKEDTYIPYDLVVKSTSLSVDVAELIPAIDSEVLRDLPVTLLDTLYSNEIFHSPKRLSYDESRDLILRMLYGIDPLLIRTNVQLLRFLLHIHYDRPEIPESLLNFVSARLLNRKEFKKWDIDLLVHNRNAFFQFLQEHINLGDSSDIPLQHSEIKVYLDNVVQDGCIFVSDGGVRFGISPHKQHAAKERRLKERLEELSMSLPSTYMEWLKFMDTWSTMVSTIYTEYHPGANRDLFSSLRNMKELVNKHFTEWLEKSYGSLYNHPPSSPVMVHHLPRYMLQNILQGRRTALLVIDGLSVSQWKVIQSSLGAHSDREYSIKESALFAWIPTLTSVSRQALLSGKLPLSISRFLYDTSREEKLWNNFWEDNGFGLEKVGYRKIQGESQELSGIKEFTESNFQVFALIVNKIDSIMHGQKQGNAMMHKEVQHWAESNIMTSIIEILFRHYDDIYLTSDHGNDEAVGIGSFSQGALIKEQGQRCRIYDSAQFRQEAQEVYTESIPWPQIGLPENYYPLLAPYGKAFTKEESMVVTHGGASIDEVIVPFIHLSKEGKHYG
jgi:hypothetical protein